MDDADFGTLLTRARSGNDEATAALLRAFEADVRIMVRVRLPRVLRSQFDSMDFVQAVWQSVFAGGGRGSEFAGAGQFRQYLAGVAKNKVYEEYRRRTKTQKFNIRLEEPLHVHHGRYEGPRDLPSTDPSPSKWIQAEECRDRLVRGRPPVEARVVDLRLQRLTFDEIAAQTGLQERAVRRVIEAARKRLESE